MRFHGKDPQWRSPFRWRAVSLAVALVGLVLPVISAGPASGSTTQPFVEGSAVVPACSVSEITQVYPGYSVSPNPTTTTTSSSSINTCAVDTTATSATLSLTVTMPAGVACPDGNPDGTVTWPTCAGHSEVTSPESPGIACPFSAPGTPEPVGTTFLEWWNSLDGRSSYTCSQTSLTASTPARP